VIIGRGLLARAFEPYFGNDPRVVIFASGVSNSLETRSSEFAREHSLLHGHLADDAKRIVYFSSCGVTALDNDLTPYMRHKQSMESLVRSRSGGLVLRLPQVVGRTGNTHTLTNFLRDRILSGQHFTVWAYAERNLVDVADVAALGATLAKETSMDPSTIAIAAERSLLTPEIVKIFERVLGKTANYSIVERGTSMAIDTTRVKEVSSRLSIHLGEGYVENVIAKYYTPANGSSSDSDSSNFSTHITGA
jgi:nucleoside-diphosphate-sugar epimerase